MEEIIKITDLRLKTTETINKIINEQIIGVIVSRSTPKVVIQSVKDYQQKEEELKVLRQKVFELECLEAQENVQQNQVSGPFKSARSLIDKLKQDD